MWGAFLVYASKNVNWNVTFVGLSPTCEFCLGRCGRRCTSLHPMLSSFFTRLYPCISFCASKTNPIRHPVISIGLDYCFFLVQYRCLEMRVVRLSIESAKRVSYLLNGVRFIDELCLKHSRFWDLWVNQKKTWRMSEAYFFRCVVRSTRWWDKFVFLEAPGGFYLRIQKGQHAIVVSLSQYIVAFYHIFKAQTCQNYEIGLWAKHASWPRAISLVAWVYPDYCSLDAPWYFDHFPNLEKQ